MQVEIYIAVGHVHTYIWNYLHVHTQTNFKLYMHMHTHTQKHTTHEYTISHSPLHMLNKYAAINNTNITTCV